MNNFPPNPRNQTPEHWDLTHRAIRWIWNKVTGRGLRAKLEVPINCSYTVDALVLCGFQLRYFNKYLGESSNNIKQWQTEFACIFESKATRQDFLSTFSKNCKMHENRHAPVANFHWCVCAKGIAIPDELPNFWGMLEVCGNGLRELRRPHYIKLSDFDLYRFGYVLLWYGIDTTMDFSSAMELIKLRILSRTELRRPNHEHGIQGSG